MPCWAQTHTKVMQHLLKPCVCLRESWDIVISESGKQKHDGILKREWTGETIVV